MHAQQSPNCELAKQPPIYTLPLRPRAEPTEQLFELIVPYLRHPTHGNNEHTHTENATRRKDGPTKEPPVAVPDRRINPQREGPRPPGPRGLVNSTIGTNPAAPELCPTRQRPSCAQPSSPRAVTYQAASEQ